MNLQNAASLHEKAVQKVAKDSITFTKKIRGCDKRRRNSKVSIRHWSDGLDPLIVDYILKNRIHHSRIKVVSSTEVIIENEKE